MATRPMAKTVLHVISTRVSASSSSLLPWLLSFPFVWQAQKQTRGQVLVQKDGSHKGTGDIFGNFNALSVCFNFIKTYRHRIQKVLKLVFDLKRQSLLVQKGSRRLL